MIFPFLELQALHETLQPNSRMPPGVFRAHCRQRKRSSAAE
jgi:hypothetical protein